MRNLFKIIALALLIPVCGFSQSATGVGASGVSVGTAGSGGGGGGGGTPGGADTQLQYNNNGVFGGTSSTTYDNTTGAIDFTGAIVGTYTTMPALDVNFANYGNIYTASGDATLTFNSGTPPSNWTITYLRILPDGTSRTITIPSTWSVDRGTTITTLDLPANSPLQVKLQYVTSPSPRYEILDYQILPDQSDHAGEVLSTDGTTSFWSPDFASLVNPNNFSGIQSFSSAFIDEWAAMGSGLEVNFALVGSLKSLTSDVTLTYSSGTPELGQYTYLGLIADGTDRTATIPTTWSTTRNSNITSLLVKANSVLYVKIQYLNSRYEIIGDPFASSGSGSKIPLIDGTLVIPTGKTATVSNTITFAGTDSTTMTFPTISADIGFRNIPQNSQSAAYTMVLTDSGKHILHPTADNNARTFTIPANASVAYSIGTSITIVNQINTITIAITSDTLTWYQGTGTSSTGSRTLSPGGVATILKISATEWIITGPGVS